MWLGSNRLWQKKCHERFSTLPFAKCPIPNKVAALASLHVMTGVGTALLYNIAKVVVPSPKRLALSRGRTEGDTDNYDIHHMYAPSLCVCAFGGRGRAKCDGGQNEIRTMRRTPDVAVSSFSHVMYSAEFKDPELSPLRE